MSEEQNAAAPAVSEGNAAPAVSTPEVNSLWEPNSTEAKMAAVFDRLNPQERVNRSETGQFESKAPTEVQTTEQATEGQAQTEAPTEPAAPVAPAIEAPQSLPAALRDKWTSVPPEVAEWAAKREAESHKRITELGETAKHAEQIRQVVERYRPSLRGQSEAQAIDKLFAASDFLDRDPVKGIEWLAQAYGVDLSRWGQPQEGQSPESDEVRSLRHEIAQLQRQIADTSNRVTSREQQEQQAREQQAISKFESFAKDKSYWADIENDVVAQIYALRQSGDQSEPDALLKKAHDNALKLRDDITSKLNEEKRKADEAKAESEKKRKAEEAKKLASINVKSTQGASPKRGTWEDTLRETADRIYG